MTKFIIGCIALLSVAACTHKSANGLYVTYRIQSEAEGFQAPNVLYNDTISAFLRNKLHNQRHYIKYNGDIAILKDAKSNQETILEKDVNYKDDTYYRGSIPKGSQSLDFELYPDRSNVNKAVLVVDLMVPTNKIFIPAQVGANTSLQYGRAVCFLTKLD